MKCSLCIHGAKELGTDQTAAHLNLQSRAGHMGKRRFTVPRLRVMNMEIKDRACQLSWGVETSQNPWNEHRSLNASFQRKQIERVASWHCLHCCGWALSEGRSLQEFPHVHPLSGRPSSRRKGPGSKWEHKTQCGNMDETWKSKSSWCSVILSAFQTKANLYQIYGERDQGQIQYVWL